MATRKPKVITKKEDIEYIAHINEKDITTSFFMEMFGKFDDKSRFNTYDENAHIQKHVAKNLVKNLKM